MATITGNNNSNNWSFGGPPSGNFVIDGLGGVDSIDFGTTLRSDYTIKQNPDGSISIDAVSGASYTLSGLLYNIEILYFDSRRQMLDLRTFFTKMLTGTAESESITGTSGADSIQGLAGNDSLTGLAGNDTLDGGMGVDTAYFSGNAAGYTLGFDRTSGAWSLRDREASRDGTDTLVSIERVQFADRLVNLESRPHAGFTDLPGNVYQFFILAFGAAPGVEYLQQCADAYRGGADVKRITNVFTGKAQFTDIYPSTLTHRELASKLVANVVGQSASPAVRDEAIQDITLAMDNGLKVGDMIFTVFSNLAGLRGDAKWGATAQLFFNQIAVAKYYTETMNQSTTDRATLAAAISAVTATSDVSTEAAVVSLIGQGLLGG